MSSKEHSVPFSKPTINGAAKVVTVSNPELFGDDELILQRFDETEDEKEAEIRKPLGEMLTIDEFGVISVSMEIDVGQKVKVMENGNWVHCVVSRLTADKICVKFGDDGLFSLKHLPLLKYSPATP